MFVLAWSACLRWPGCLLPDWSRLPSRPIRRLVSKLGYPSGWSSAGLMLDHRLRRWSSIKPVLDQRDPDGHISQDAIRDLCMWTDRRQGGTGDVTGSLGLSLDPTHLNPALGVSMDRLIRAPEKLIMLTDTDAPRSRLRLVQKKDLVVFPFSSTLSTLHGNPLGKRRCCDVESTSLTLLQRRNNVVCPVGRFSWRIPEKKWFFLWSFLISYCSIYGL